MLISWVPEYTRLQRFLHLHPGIQISGGHTILPEDMRAEFTRLFDEVRKAFVHGHFSGPLEEAAVLRKNYFLAEEEAKCLLGIEGVILGADLFGFLEDPRDRLARELFDPLFCLLQGKMDPETFEQEAFSNLKRAYRNLYRQGYQKWLALSLVSLLGAGKAFQVVPPALEMGAREPIIPFEPRPIPRPREARHLSFVPHTLPAFLVPDFIIYAPALNRYVSFCSGRGSLASWAEGLWTASNPSPKRRWTELRCLTEKFGPIDLEDGLMIYVDRELADASLIADGERISHPDWILAGLGDGDEFEDVYGRLNFYQKVLEPRHAVLVASQEAALPLPDGTTRENIYFLAAGFSRSKMRSIIDHLRPAEG